VPLPTRVVDPTAAMQPENAILSPTCRSQLVARVPEPHKHRWSERTRGLSPFTLATAENTVVPQGRA
jgi:hypothetical protein